MPLQGFQAGDVFVDLLFHLSPCAVPYEAGAGVEVRVIRVIVFVEFGDVDAQVFVREFVGDFFNPRVHVFGVDVRHVFDASGFVGVGVEADFEVSDVDSDVHVFSFSAPTLGTVPPLYCLLTHLSCEMVRFIFIFQFGAVAGDSSLPPSPRRLRPLFNNTPELPEGSRIRHFYFLTGSNSKRGAGLIRGVFSRLFGIPARRLRFLGVRRIPPPPLCHKTG